MPKLFTKTVTRLISDCHRSSSTTRNLSAAPPQTNNLETQLITSDTPPAKKRGSSVWLWYLVGSITYCLGESYKILQTEVYNKHMEFRRQCLEMKPRNLNTTKNVDKLGFRRVVCKGVFDVQRSIYVGPKPRSMSKGFENGFYVITPLLLIPNEPNSIKSPVLVNRGWVPSDWKEKSLESIDTGVVVAVEKSENLLSKFLYKFNNPMIAEDQVSKAMHMEVVGVVRKCEPPVIYYSIVNYPSSLAWFFLDVPKLAQAMGFSEDTMFIENTQKDMDESRPNYPVPRDVENLIRSEDTPLNYHFYKAICHSSSLFCFGKAKSILLEKYTQYSIKPIWILVIVLFYISTKIYSVSTLFSKIDTIGVGCVTQLDSGEANEDSCHK